jgi:hypothetical protein
MPDAVWSGSFHNVPTIVANGTSAIVMQCMTYGTTGLWKLASRSLDVRLAWSSTSYGGKFAGMQPEEVDNGELHALLTRE